MNGTSSGSDLQARLQKRAERDRQEIEALTQGELKKLAENLRQSVQRRDVYHRARYQGSHPVDERGAVATVAAERDGRGVSLSRHLGRELGPDAVAVRTSIENLIETKAVFQVEIKEATPAPSRGSKETTWGVVLHEGEEGRRFVDPAGRVAPGKSTLDRGRAACRAGYSSE